MFLQTHLSIEGIYSFSSKKCDILVKNACKTKGAVLEQSLLVILDNCLHCASIMSANIKRILPSIQPTANARPHHNSLSSDLLSDMQTPIPKMANSHPINNHNLLPFLQPFRVVSVGIGVTSSIRPILMPLRAMALKADCAPGPGALSPVPPLALSLMWTAVMLSCLRRLTMSIAACMAAQGDDSSLSALTFMPPVTLAKVQRPVRSVTWMKVSFQVARMWQTAKTSPEVFWGPRARSCLAQTASSAAPYSGLPFFLGSLAAALGAGAVGFVSSFLTSAIISIQYQRYNQYQLLPLRADLASVMGYGVGHLCFLSSHLARTINRTIKICQPRCFLIDSSLPLWFPRFLASSQTSLLCHRFPCFIIDFLASSQISLLPLYFPCFLYDFLASSQILRFVIDFLAERACGSKQSQQPHSK